MGKFSLFYTSERVQHGSSLRLHITLRWWYVQWIRLSVVFGMLIKRQGNGNGKK